TQFDRRHDPMEAWLEALFTQTPIVLLFGVIIITLGSLSKGADLLVDEAVTLSARWGIPKVVIGATIVSVGTTLPEASVSVAAAVGGNPDIAFGNAIGSIICDSSLIIGIASLIRPLPVHRSSTNHQSLLQLSAGVLLVLIALPWSSLSGLFAIDGRIPQWAGFLFIILLVMYLINSFQRAKRGVLNTADYSEEIEEAEKDPSPIPVVVLKLAIGLVLIIISSKVLIPAVRETALRLGIPKSIIAATLVAFGTSLPELITAVQASRKGHGELAIGNVIGADILNILFVVGVSAAVTSGGLLVPSYFYWFHLPFMMMILILFRAFLTIGKPMIGRIHGFVLLAVYVLYSVLGYVIV
ncbi:MAG: calcium/sodium antiporter, partial [Spirochaetota bacterium]